jgi:hypothetical protein
MKEMKPGLILIGILLIITISAVPAYSSDNEIIKVSIPEYQVSSESGIDHVFLPGGEILLAEEGRPKVPYYIKSIDYPAGQRVQNVLLKERTGLETATGLVLPVVIEEQYPEVPVTMKSGWYPLEMYRWQVWENGSGGTTLSIIIFPFYYNADTTDVEFYREYVFEIESSASTTTISRIVTDREIYTLKDQINIELFINNTSAPQDVVINLEIKNLENGESEEGLQLGLLPGLSGEASYNAIWDSSSAAAGDYRLEATLTDTTGSILDVKKTLFLIREIKDIPPETGKPTESTPSLPAEEKTRKIPIVYIIGGAVIILAAIIAIVVWRKRKG